MDFEHERLDVYRAAREWLVAADHLAEKLPKGRGYLVDQLRHAASSVFFNIGEAAGEFSMADKIRIYRIARRSATECATIVDGLVALRLVDEERARHGRQLLWRIVAMLTAISRRLRELEASGVSFDRLE